MKITIAPLFLLLLLLLVWCNAETPNHNQPNHHVPNSDNREKRGRGVILVSILLGSLTGLSAALVSAFLLRSLFTLINTLPILKGPVVFSPLISPKSLLLLLPFNQTDLIKPTGNYYKTQLHAHALALTVAVKKVHTPPLSNSVKRRIQKELQILATITHRHLMTLRAYLPPQPNNNDICFCLVYDYIPTASLEDAFSNTDIQLGWDARLRIAVGIIKALHYLHYTCSPPIFHYNLKPSNVLLDPDFQPRLADSALPNIFIHPISLYYCPPECFTNFSMYTEKSDIFSFGVILGILLTGRDPSDPFFSQLTTASRSRGDMGMWFRQLVESGDAREALDKTLLGEEMEEDEMLMAVRIAAVCLSDIPADRPSSDELVPMLTQLHSF